MYEVKEEDLKLSSNFEKANQKILKKKEEIILNNKNENQDTIAILDVNKPLEVLSLENGTFKTITRDGQEVFLQFYKSVPLNLVD